MIEAGTQRSLTTEDPRHTARASISQGTTSIQSRQSSQMSTGQSAATGQYPYDPLLLDPLLRPQPNPQPPPRLFNPADYDATFRAPPPASSRQASYDNRRPIAYGERRADIVAPVVTQPTRGVRVQLLTLLKVSQGAQHRPQVSLRSQGIPSPGIHFQGQKLQTSEDSRTGLHNQEVRISGSHPEVIIQDLV